MLRHQLPGKQRLSARPGWAATRGGRSRRRCHRRIMCCSSSRTAMAGICCCRRGGTSRHSCSRDSVNGGAAGALSSGALGSPAADAEPQAGLGRTRRPLAQPRGHVSWVEPRWACTKAQVLASVHLPLPATFERLEKCCDHFASHAEMRERPRSDRRTRSQNPAACCATTSTQPGQLSVGREPTMHALLSTLGVV